jgi:nucleoside-diphosphate-sugar epimerase
VKVLITGGTGFIGLRLARRLLERVRLTGAAGREEEIDKIVLFDAVVPPERPPGLDDRVELVAGDIVDRDIVFSLVDRDDISIFHLASIVSAHGEQDFDLAIRVNLDGGRNVLEAARARAGMPRVVVASTYAAFGGAAMLDVCGDTTKLTPQTTYGTTKVILELLLNDYTRKGFVDGRAARLPTVIVRPGKPNRAASSWVSGILREPLAGLTAELPVPLDTPHPVAGVRTVIEGFVRLHEVDGALIGDDRTVNFPSVPVTPEQMLASLKRVGANRVLGEVVLKPDEAIRRIVTGWPRQASFERARALGLPDAGDLDSIVRAYVEDYVDA